MNKLSSDILVEQFQVGPMANFAYFIGSVESREGVLVDPAWEPETLLAFVAEHDYQLTGVVATHFHPDHVGGVWAGLTIPGVADILNQHTLPVYVHKLDADAVKELTGIGESDVVKTTSGYGLDLGSLHIEFLHTPGHTPGSQCLKVSDLLVSGDTLFIDCCGRVDLPGADPDEMFHSIKKIESLSNDTVLLPGHDYSSVPKATMAEVKKCNSVFSIRDLEAWRQFMHLS